MLERVKLSLRVTSKHFEPEIEGLIEAAELDLVHSGITLRDDALINRAIITYCKANFGYDNPEAERFMDSYISIKQHLMMFGDYNAT